jgi:hypothetical protein
LIPIPSSLCPATPHNLEARSMKPRWLEILQVELHDPHLAIAAVVGVFIVILHFGVIPLLDRFPFLSPLAWFFLLLFGFLWIFQVVNALRSKLPKR